MATQKPPKARKQRIRREQVREAQRRRRERLRLQHQRFLQLLVPEDVHELLTKVATDLELSVQQLALDLIRKALGLPPLPPSEEEEQAKPSSSDKVIAKPKVAEATTKPPTPEFVIPEISDFHHETPIEASLDNNNKDHTSSKSPEPEPNAQLELF